MRLYLAVTPDEYELPLIVADSMKELAEMTGRTLGCIKGHLSHKSSGRNIGMKFIRVIVED